MVRPHSYEIVDGQQRLATFVLALSCVASLAADLRERASQAKNTQATNSAKTLATDTQERMIFWKEANVAAGVTVERPRLQLSLSDDPVFQQLLAGGTPVATRESHTLLIDARDALMAMVTKYVGWDCRVVR